MPDPTYITKVRLDAGNRQIVIEVVDSGTGVVNMSWGQVVLKLGMRPLVGFPTSPETSMGQPLAIRETKGCDAAGNPAYCFMLRSPWVPTSLTADPET